MLKAQPPSPGGGDRSRRTAQGKEETAHVSQAQPLQQGAEGLYEGLIGAIRRMMAEGRDCEEILLQLSAAESAINKVAKIVLKDHFNHCVKEGIESGDLEAVESFNAILDKYLK